MNGLSLFSGIGGLDLAFQWAGGNIIAMCEIDTFCRKVLLKHWPDIPIFEDIKEMNASYVGAVDVIYGGFPCQPFSLAGNKKGKDDSRYLWPEFSRLVAEIKPRWVVAENVPGILRIAADDVCGDLERQGYSVGIWSYEAASVGAPHRRERVFFVAHARRSLRQRISETRDVREADGTGNTFAVERPSSAPMADADSVRELQQEGNITHQRGWPSDCCEKTDVNSKRLTKSGMVRVVDGVSCGLDGSRLTYWETVPEPERIVQGTKDRGARLRALGNAVVPQQAYLIFKTIINIDMEAIS